MAASSIGARAKEISYAAVQRCSARGQKERARFGGPVSLRSTNAQPYGVEQLAPIWFRFEMASAIETEPLGGPAREPAGLRSKVKPFEMPSRLSSSL